MLMNRALLTRDFWTHVPLASRLQLVQADTGCTPSVDSFEPLTVTISEPVTFTAYGSCLPDTTAFHVGGCADKESLGGSDTERQFRCTPIYSVGIKDDGVIKTKAGIDEVLFNFSVNVEWGTPEVTSVTPTSANLYELTEFFVRGKSLTDECPLLY